MTVTERVIAGLACAFFCYRAISAGLRGVYSGDGDPDVHLARFPAAFALTVISGPSSPCCAASWPFHRAAKAGNLQTRRRVESPRRPSPGNIPRPVVWAPCLSRKTGPMRLTHAALPALLAILAASPAVAATGIVGTWLAPARAAHIRIYHCGEAVCGRIVSASRPKDNPKLLDIHNQDPALRHRSMVGAVLIEGFTGGPTSWTGGRVYNPGDGKSYKGSLTLVDPGHLKMQGCVIGVLCKSQVLKRIG